MVKKILLTSLVILLSGGLLGSWFWYVGRLEARGRSEADCRRVDVILLDSLESRVVDRMEMHRFVSSRVLGQRTDTIDLHGIEQAVRSRGEVMSAEVYVRDPHTVAVEISQRKPVVRFEKGAEHWYSDPEGYLFPVVHAVDVPVVTGNIPLSPGPGYKGLAPSESRQWVLDIVDLAMEISDKQGQKRYHEKTGGAGDIAIAGLAGIGVLDGLGLAGEKMHTTEECVDLASLPRQIDFAAEMIVNVFRCV